MIPIFVVFLNRITLLTNNVAWPNGLTIDYDSGRVFWCDSFLNTIESILIPVPQNKRNAKQQTSGWAKNMKIDRKIHFSSKMFVQVESEDDGYRNNNDLINHPYGLAIYENTIFWSEFESGHIMKLNMVTNITTLVRKEYPKIFSLKDFSGPRPH